MGIETEKDEYKDGWIGFTKADLKRMYDTNTAQWPAWIFITSGSGFDARASLKANGLHPKKIPSALRDHIFAGKLIKEIAKYIDLEYVETPDQ